MNDRKDTLQILGILMKKPSLLSQTDKYILSLSDFSSRFDKYIFDAIKGLYTQGAKVIDIVDIENYLEFNAVAKKTFQDNNGIEYLQDALAFSSVENFDYYYTHLKKINLVKALKKSGFDTSDIYNDNPLNVDTEDINANFENLSVPEIISSIKKKFLQIEHEFTYKEVSETHDISYGIKDLIKGFKDKIDVGLPLQGEIFNEVLSGARKGTLTIRSAGSGVGKSRSMVGDACYLAFPLRYDHDTESWIICGSCEKVLYIATEQTFSEIQSMVLAYLTGINESKFKYGIFTPNEEKIINQAIIVMNKYKDNLQITQIPNPNNEIVKNVIRENCMMYGCEYVFYDYIFICPSLLNEFKGFNLRNDELLLIMATSLKDVAVEMDVFVMTATQVNANADDNKDIRNESSLAGGRATINKADYGFIMARPTKEELSALEKLMNTAYDIPNLVTDVFKVRAGEWTQVRIWSIFDRGTLRKKDLFMTDSRLEVQNYQPMFNFDYESVPFDEIEELIRKLEAE